MDNKKLKIEYIPTEAIKPYKNNAKLHTREQIEQIKKSIQQFGFNDPVALWKDECVEGHGRILAATELGIDKIPIIRLDTLTDEERRAYALIHNQLTLNTGWDLDLLDFELGEIELDMSEFGFNLSFGEDEPQEIVEDNFDEEPPEEPKSKLGDIWQLGRWVYCKKCGKKHYIS